MAAEEEQQACHYKHGEYCVVRDGVKKEEVECQLEVALEDQLKVVVVEPGWLGDQTLRWIRFGNFLHKTSVLSCLGVLLFVPAAPGRVRSFVVLPLGLVGLSCVALYNVSWQFDPCCKYQVDAEGRELACIPSHDLLCPSPVVLVLRNDKYRKRLQNTLALAVLAMLGWKLYRYLLL